MLQTFPNDEPQEKWGYNVLAVVSLGAAAVLPHWFGFYGWLSLFFVLLLTGLYFYDLYVLPYLQPNVKLVDDSEQEASIEEHMQEWLSGQQERAMRGVQRQVTDLQRQVDELRRAEK